MFGGRKRHLRPFCLWPWAPAAVTGMGEQLSHGSIVARVYGITAVAAACLPARDM